MYGLITLHTAAAEKQWVWLATATQFFQWPNIYIYYIVIVGFNNYSTYVAQVCIVQLGILIFDRSNCICYQGLFRQEMVFLFPLSVISYSPIAGVICTSLPHYSNLSNKAFACGPNPKYVLSRISLLLHIHMHKTLQEKTNTSKDWQNNWW